MTYRIWKVAAAILLMCGIGHAQEIDPQVKENSAKARMALDGMVQALGGDAWLKLKNHIYEGRTSGFYRGDPTGAVSDYIEFHEWPDKDRIEYGNKHDVVQIETDSGGWEVTYQGKKELPKDIVDEWRRRRDHSIELVLKVWLNDPKSVLIFEGQGLVERHLADQVTVLSAANEAVTIQMDAQTHLPLRRTYRWRDPVYKDKNEDSEEYDNYQAIGGFPTPFTITRFHNGDMVNQRFLHRAYYNETLPPGAFDVNQTLSKIKK